MSAASQPQSAVASGRSSPQPARATEHQPPMSPQLPRQQVHQMALQKPSPVPPQVSSGRVPDRQSLSEVPSTSASRAQSNDSAQLRHATLPLSQGRLPQQAAAQLQPSPTHRAPSIESTGSARTGGGVSVNELKLLQADHGTAFSELETKIQEMTGLLQTSSQQLKTMPPVTLDQHDSEGARIHMKATIQSAAMLAAGQGPSHPAAQTSAVVYSVVEKLFEEHQQRQHELLESLATRWERRFAALEQALNSGLESATTAAFTMNERLAKFMTLATALEGAVEKAMTTAQRASALSREVRKVEGDLAVLAKEVAKDRRDHFALLERFGEELHQRVGLHCQKMAEDVKNAARLSTPGQVVIAPPGANTTQCLSELERVARELTEERMERRQLQIQLQKAVTDTTQLQGLLSQTNESLHRLKSDVASRGIDAAKEIAGWGPSPHFHASDTSPSARLSIGCIKEEDDAAGSGEGSPQDAPRPSAIGMPPLRGWGS